MTEGQYLFVVVICATVLVVGLQLLRRRLLRNELPDELYNDTADIPSRPQFKM